MNQIEIFSSVKDEFASLFQLESGMDGARITTPFKLIDSTLLKVLVISTDEGFTVSDEGQIWEAILSYSMANESVSRKDISQLATNNRIEFFDDMTFSLRVKNEKIIGSAIFDLGAFGVQASGASHFFGPEIKENEF